MNVEIIMSRWFVCFFIEAVALVAVLMHESHCRARRRERRCEKCGSEDVGRFHEMRELPEVGGGCFMTKTWSKCRDCGAVRIDKHEHPKFFSVIDLLWRRWAYKQQFVCSGGQMCEHLTYHEGDFAKKLTISEYFNRPETKITYRKPSLRV